MKAPHTVGSSGFEVRESDPVDVHLSLLLARVHKQSSAPFGAQLKKPTSQKTVLHLALGLIEGGPGHPHGTWHSCEGKHNYRNRDVD